MIKKIVKALFILSLTFFLLYGCRMGISYQESKHEGVDLLIGMSNSDLSDPWQISLYEQMKEEIKKHDHVHIIFRNAARSTYTQIKDINTLMDFGIDVLIVTVNDENVLKPVIREVQKKIPVIVLDRSLDSYDYSMFIGPDNYKIGQQAGKKAAQLLGEKGGTVVEIIGSLESPSSLERSNGFRDALKNEKNIHVVASLQGDWQRDQAEDLFKKYLDKNKKVDLVFAHNDAMALGAYNAAVSSRVNGIRFIGVGKISDDQKRSVEWIKNGILDSLILYPIGGKEAINYAIQLYSHQENIPKKIILRSYEVDRTNLENIPPDLGDERMWLQNKERKRNKIKIGFVGKGYNDPWNREVFTSIQEAAIREGFELIVENVEEKGNKPPGQKDQIEALQDLIDKKVDVILLSPLVKSGWETILRQIKLSDIPVILINGELDAEDDLWLTYIGSDYHDQGEMAARWMIENLYNGKENLQIAELISMQGSTETEGKMEGFNDMVKGYSNIRVQSWGIGEPTVERGREAMAKILEQNPNKINVVYAHNDALALGAVKAIEEAGLKPGKDIKIISIEGTENGLEQLKNGKINMIVKINPFIGLQVMKYIKDLTNLKEIPKKMINEDRPITKTDLTGNQ